MAETALMDSLLDPNSYDLISYKIDTVRKSDFEKIGCYGDSSIGDLYLKFAHEEAKESEWWFEHSYSSSFITQGDRLLKNAKSFSDSSSKYFNRYRTKLKQIDLLKKSDKDSIYTYKILLTYYNNNRTGSKIIDKSMAIYSLKKQEITFIEKR